MPELEDGLLEAAPVHVAEDDEREVGGGAMGRVLTPTVAGQEEQVTEGIGDGGRDGGEGGSGVGPGGRSEDNGGSGGGGHGDAASAGRYAAPLPSAAARHPSRLTLPERWGRDFQMS
uniref:DUF834 domain-containing protein n=1 Tax=Oryza glumipatula TaxID=40148 RepID=A0A0E0ADK4_9ORYZ